MSSRIVHVIGTGNVGEPLIGLLSDFKQALGLDEVTFTKRSPLGQERAKVESLVRRGAQLCVDRDMHEEFIRQGHRPLYDAEEALARASVVVDCTPLANRSKTQYMSLQGPSGFVAAGGTDFGFGKLYVNELNDPCLVPDEDRFIQVPGGNSHTLSYLLHLFAFDGACCQLERARFVLMRRACDFSQEVGFVPSPRILPHDVERFGTHHAREAHYVFRTMGHDLDIRSSVVLLPTQQLHTLWFSLEMKRPLDVIQARERAAQSPLCAVTDKQSATQVLAFSRDHGWMGRIFCRVVIPTVGLTSIGNRLEGFCFEPQDSNELVSTAAAAVFFLYPREVKQRLACLSPYMFREV